MSSTPGQYAAENDLCSHLKIKKLKEKKPVPRALREDDAAKLIDAATGDLKFLLLFLFLQGWRVSDTLRLTWRDLDLRRGTVAYRITKTDEWLTVPLSAAVLEAFREREQGVGRVFRWSGLKAVLAAEGASVQEIMEAGVWRDYRSVLRYAKADVPRVRAIMNRIKVCKTRAGS